MLCTRIRLLLLIIREPRPSALFLVHQLEGHGARESPACFVILLSCPTPSNERAVYVWTEPLLILGSDILEVNQITLGITTATWHLLLLSQFNGTHGFKNTASPQQSAVRILHGAIMVQKPMQHAKILLSTLLAGPTTTTPLYSCMVKRWFISWLVPSHPP
jgi:hypothetical protein